MTRQPLQGASVDIYVNHTLKSSTQTGEKGEVLLWLDYSPGLSLTLLGHMEGYVPTPLPWSTNKRPSESQHVPEIHKKYRHVLQTHTTPLTPPHLHYLWSSLFNEVSATTFKFTLRFLTN